MTNGTATRHAFSLALIAIERQVLEGKPSSRIESRSDEDRENFYGEWPQACPVQLAVAFGLEESGGIGNGPIPSPGHPVEATVSVCNSGEGIPTPITSRESMAESTGDDRSLLVPIVNEQTATRQLATAIDLARDRGARIHLLFVLEVPAQLSLEDGRRYLLEDDHEALVADAADRVASNGIEVEEHIRMARGVARGIVGAASEYDVDELLLGWRGRPPHEGLVLGNHVDAVLQSAPCDVLVRRIKTRTPSIESILVGVAGGPHGAYAADVAASIARERDASVRLAHVHDPDDGGLERDEAEALLVRTMERFDGVDDVDRDIRTSTSVGATLTDLSADHDVTVLGVSEGGLIRRRLLGSVSDAVGRHAAGTVILARRRDPVPSRLRRLLS